jgi:PKD repeat protein
MPGVVANTMPARVIAVVCILGLVVGLGAPVALSSAASNTVTWVDSNETNGWEDRSVWRNTYETRSKSGRFEGVSLTDDGFLFTGGAEEYLGGEFYEIEGFVVQTNRNGSAVWARGFLHANTENRTLYDGITYGNDRYVFAGSANIPNLDEPSDYLLFNNDRQVHDWQIRVPGGVFYDLIPTDDDVTVAVANDSVGRVRYNGTVEWVRHVDNRSLRAGTNRTDGYVIAGQSSAGGESREQAHAAAFTLDGNGSVGWNRTYRAGSESLFHDVATLPGDGLVFGGHASTTTRQSGLLVVTGPNGTERWRDRPIPGGVVHAVAAGPDRTIVVAGHTPEDGGVLLVYDMYGTVTSRQHYGRTLRAVEYAGGGSFVVAGAAGQPPDSHLLGVLVDATCPTPDLRTDADRPEVGVTNVSFDASGSTDNVEISTYHWDFDGDGTVDRTTDVPNVTHVYATTGPVTPSLSTTDSAGYNGTTTTNESITVIDETAPVAVLSDPHARRAAVSAPTVLNASGSHDNHRISTYRWDFDGDGVIDEETSTPETTYTFPAENETYPVRVTAVDPSGFSNTTETGITTRPNDTPTVRARVIDIDRYRGPETQYNYTATVRANVTDRVGTTTVTWRLPNESTRTGTGVTFHYRERADIVEAIARDEYGASNSSTVTLEEQQPNHDGFGLSLAVLAALVSLALVAREFDRP